MFFAQSAQEDEFGLEIDVVRELQVFDEAGRLNVVGVGEDEFLILGGGEAVFAEFVGAQRPVDEGHRHRLALGLAEDEAVTASELGRCLGGAFELRDHLAFGQLDRADGDGEAQLFYEDLDFDFAEPDLANEGVRAAVAALRRIAEREEIAFIAAREVLQAQVAAGGKLKRFTGQVADGFFIVGAGRWLRGDWLRSGRRGQGAT